MRTGFISPLTVLITAKIPAVLSVNESLERASQEQHLAFVSENLARARCRSEGDTHTLSTVSRHTLSPADGNRNLAVSSLSTD